MTRKRRHIHVFDKEISGEEFQRLFPTGVIKRVPNQRVKPEQSGKETELFGLPVNDPTVKSKVWIVEE